MGLSFGLLGRMFIGSQALQLGPLVALGGFGGLVGSYLDSVVGQLFQASYLDTKEGFVVEEEGPNTVHICGTALLSNTQVRAFWFGLVCECRMFGNVVEWDHSHFQAGMFRSTLCPQMRTVGEHHRAWS